jgi:uncharacterized hydrophobic protein (TIGR00271 family)
VQASLLEGHRQRGSICEDGGVMHVRVVVPVVLREPVLGMLRTEPAVCHIIESTAATEKPAGTVLEFDIPVESANAMIFDLQQLGLDRHGSITAIRLDVALSASADLAEQAAVGNASEAVVWAEVSARTNADSQATTSFLVLMALSMAIAAVGILIDSLILIVGAMALGPEFGPISNIAYGLHRRRPARIRRGLATLALGFGVGIVAAWVLTELVQLIDRVPTPYENGQRPLTSFISHPDVFSAIVAVLAGVAGTVSLLEAKSSALIGMFISVTTIPASANIGVAIAMGEFNEAQGALIQLVVNVVCIVGAGAVTMTVARRSWHRARDRRRRMNLPETA